MPAKLANMWQDAISNLWFIPGLLVLAAIAVSSGLLYVDGTLAPNLSESAPWLFGGTAGAARGLLAVVAGSLITVISIAFSITIVALQGASSQYSPRVLRNFTSDHGNQVVLGTYLATFTYALLVMRQVRETSGDQAAFVPSISITVAIALALVSIGMLVYFIDHISSSLQVISILAAIRKDLYAEIDTLFPGRFGEGSEDPPKVATLVQQMARERYGQETVVRSTGAGYLRTVDEDWLIRVTPEGVRFVWVCPQIGDYVHPGTVLTRIWADESLTEDHQNHVRGAFVLDKERTLHRDPLFGIRQMVDIGVKALSPGVNDPTTAEQSLAHLGDAITRVQGREFPSPLRRTEQGVCYLFNRPDFADYVDASFSQIRRAASTQLHVIFYLLNVLGDLADQAQNPRRLEPLREQVDQIVAGLESSGFTRDDQEAVRDRAREILAALQEKRKRTQRAA